MRKTCCFIPLLLFMLNAAAQKKKTARPAEEGFTCWYMTPSAIFPGGNEAWLRYIQKNNRLDRIYRSLPDSIVSWKARVHFVINRSGRVENVKIESDSAIHPLYIAELRRLMLASPKWTPAVENGRTVKEYRQQPVIFIVEDEKEIKTDHAGNRISK